MIRNPEHDPLREKILDDFEELAEATGRSVEQEMFDFSMAFLQLVTDAKHGTYDDS